MIINIQIDDGTVATPDGTEMGLVLGMAVGPEVESIHIDTDVGEAEVIFRDKGNDPNVFTSVLTLFIPAVQAFDLARIANVDAANAVLDAMDHEDIRNLVFPSIDEMVTARWEEEITGTPGQIAPLEAARVAAKLRFPMGETNAELRSRYLIDTGLDTLVAIAYPSPLAPLIGG